MTPLRETIKETLENVVAETVTTPYMTVTFQIVSMPDAICQVIAVHQNILIVAEGRVSDSLVQSLKKPKVEDPAKDPIIFHGYATRQGVEYFQTSLDAVIEDEPASNYLKDKTHSMGKIHGCPNVLLNDTTNFVQNIFTETDRNDRRSLILRA